jgi:hypothetical protein
MYVEVTQEDIDAGCAEDPEYCPVAKACLRAGAAWASIADDVITLDVKFGETFVERVWPTPPAVLAFIHAFDRGQDVHPFVFDLDDLSEIIKTADDPTHP